MRIKELKEFINDLPEDGEVWIGNGRGLSNEATKLHKLNRKDILLDIA